jgi:hypothetical protein
MYLVDPIFFIKNSQDQDTWNVILLKPSTLTCCWEREEETSSMQEDFAMLQVSILMGANG